MQGSRKKSKTNATLAVLRYGFPSEILVAGSFFFFFLTVLSLKVISNFASEWSLQAALLISVCLLMLTSLAVLFCKTIKQITITRNEIIIKRRGYFQLENYYSENVKGYELYEMFIQGESTFIVRIIRNDGKPIHLNNSYCRNYGKAFQAMPKTSFNYLGKKEFQFKYKHTLYAVAKWSTILFPLLFLAHSLFKLITSLE